MHYEEQTGLGAAAHCAGSMQPAEQTPLRSPPAYGSHGVETVPIVNSSGGGDGSEGVGGPAREGASSYTAANDDGHRLGHHTQDSGTAHSTGGKSAVDVLAQPSANREDTHASNGGNEGLAPRERPASPSLEEIIAEPSGTMYSQGSGRLMETGSITGNGLVFNRQQAGTPPPPPFSSLPLAGAPLARHTVLDKHLEMDTTETPDEVTVLRDDAAFEENSEKLEITFKPHTYAPNYIFGFPGMNGWSVSGNVIVKNVSSNELIVDNFKVVFVGQTETKIKRPQQQQQQLTNPSQRNKTNAGLPLDEQENIVAELAKPLSPNTPLLNTTTAGNVNSNGSSFFPSASNQYTPINNQENQFSEVKGSRIGDGPLRTSLRKSKLLKGAAREEDPASSGTETDDGGAQDKFDTSTKIHIRQEMLLVEDRYPRSSATIYTEELRLSPGESIKLCFSVDFPSNNLDLLMRYADGSDTTGFENGSFKPRMDLPDPCKVVNGTESCSAKTSYFLSAQTVTYEQIKLSKAERNRELGYKNNRPVSSLLSRASTIVTESLTSRKAKRNSHPVNSPYSSSHLTDELLSSRDLDTSNAVAPAAEQNSEFQSVDTPSSATPTTPGVTTTNNHPSSINCGSSVNSGNSSTNLRRKFSLLRPFGSSTNNGPSPLQLDTSSNVRDGNCGNRAGTPTTLASAASGSTTGAIDTESITSSNATGPLSSRISNATRGLFRRLTISSSTQAAKVGQSPLVSGTPSLADDGNALVSAPSGTPTSAPMNIEHHQPRGFAMKSSSLGADRLSNESPESHVINSSYSNSQMTKNGKYTFVEHKTKMVQPLRFIWFRAPVIEQLMRNDMPPSMTWFGKIKVPEEGRTPKSNNEVISRNGNNVAFNYIVTLDSNVLEPGRSFTLRFRCTPTMKIFDKNLIKPSTKEVISQSFNPVNNESMDSTRSIVTALAKDDHYGDVDVFENKGTKLKSSKPIGFKSNGKNKSNQVIVVEEEFGFGKCIKRRSATQSSGDFNGQVNKNRPVVPPIQTNGIPQMVKVPQQLTANSDNAANPFTADTDINLGQEHDFGGISNNIPPKLFSDELDIQIRDPAFVPVFRSQDSLAFQRVAEAGNENSVKSGSNGNSNGSSTDEIPISDLLKDEILDRQLPPTPSQPEPSEREQDTPFMASADQQHASYIHAQDPGRTPDERIKMRMANQEAGGNKSVQGEIGAMHPEYDHLGHQEQNLMRTIVSQNESHEGHGHGSSNLKTHNEIVQEDEEELTSLIRVRKLTLSVRENVLIKSGKSSRLLQRRIVDWHYTAPHNDPNFYHFSLGNIDARVFHVKLSSRANTSGNRSLANLYHTCRISVELETAYKNRMQVVLVECPVNIMYWGFTRSERLLERIARGRMDVEQVICVEPLPLYTDKSDGEPKNEVKNSANKGKKAILLTSAQNSPTRSNISLKPEVEEDTIEEDELDKENDDPIRELVHRKGKEPFFMASNEHTRSHTATTSTSLAPSLGPTIGSMTNLDEVDRILLQEEQENPNALIGNQLTRNANTPHYFSRDIPSPNTLLMRYNRRGNQNANNNVRTANRPKDIPSITTANLDKPTPVTPPPPFSAGSRDYVPVVMSDELRRNTGVGSDPAGPNNLNFIRPEVIQHVEMPNEEELAEQNDNNNVTITDREGVPLPSGSNINVVDGEDGEDGATVHLGCSDYDYDDDDDYDQEEADEVEEFEEAETIDSLGSGDRVRRRRRLSILSGNSGGRRGTSRNSNTNSNSNNLQPNRMRSRSKSNPTRHFEPFRIGDTTNMDSPSGSMYEVARAAPSMEVSKSMPSSSVTQSKNSSGIATTANASVASAQPKNVSAVGISIVSDTQNIDTATGPTVATAHAISEVETTTMTATTADDYTTRSIHRGNVGMVMNTASNATNSHLTAPNVAMQLSGETMSATTYNGGVTMLDTATDDVSTSHRGNESGEDGGEEVTSIKGLAPSSKLLSEADNEDGESGGYSVSENHERGPIRVEISKEEDDDIVENVKPQQYSSVASGVLRREISEGNLRANLSPVNSSTASTPTIASGASVLSRHNLPLDELDFGNTSNMQSFEDDMMNQFILNSGELRARGSATSSMMDFEAGDDDE